MDEPGLIVLDQVFIRLLQIHQDPFHRRPGPVGQAANSLLISKETSLAVRLAAGRSRTEDQPVRTGFDLGSEGIHVGIGKLRTILPVKRIP